MFEEKKQSLENSDNYSLKDMKENLYFRAAFMRRILAGLIDHFICLLFITLFLLSINSFVYLTFFNSSYFGLFFLFIILIIEIYYFTCELYLNGQTPGKMLLKIRVISDTEKIKVSNLLIRNSFRCLYLLPPLFIIPDIIFMLIDKRGRRIGDLVGGTVVVKKYIG